MASYNGNVAVHETLAASTVDTVNLAGATGQVGLTVVNRSGTAEIYFTVATGAVGPTAPTVGGNDTYVVPASIASLTLPGITGAVIVKLISSGTPNYSVEALQ
jgi:hypothetical protein